MGAINVEIWARTLAPDGTLTSPVHLGAETDAPFGAELSVAAGADGAAIVAWSAKGTAKVARHAAGAPFAPDSGVPLNSPMEAGPLPLDAAAGPAGTGYVAYSAVDGSGLTHVQVARVPTDAGAIGPVVGPSTP